MSPSSHLRQFSDGRDGLRIARSFDWVDGYNTRIEVATQLDPQSSQQLLVRTQFGGAAEEVRAMSLKGGILKETDSRFGNWSEVRDFGSSLILLVVHDAISGVDAPYLFQLQNGRFRNVSRSHPDYYQKLLASEGLKADGSNLSPTLYDQLARLVRLGGDEQGAKLLEAKYESATPSLHQH